MFKIFRWFKVYRWYKQLKADLKAGQEINWVQRFVDLLSIINDILDAEGLPTAPHQTLKPVEPKPVEPKPETTDYDFT